MRPRFIVGILCVNRIISYIITFPVITSSWSILSYIISYSEIRAKIMIYITKSLSKWVQSLVNYSYILPSFVTYISQLLAYDHITLETNGFSTPVVAYIYIICGYIKTKHRVYVKIFFNKFGDLNFFFRILFVCNFFPKIWRHVVNVLPSMVEDRR